MNIKKNNGVFFYEENASILKYNSDILKNFIIDEKGNIENLKTGKIIKSHKDCNGYLVTPLPMGKRGKVKIVRNHKAVADTFIENPNNYPVVHHKDENKSNCTKDNLEHTTHAKNTYYHLLNESKKNSLFNNRKLTKEEADDIRKLKNVYSLEKLANMYNVSKTTIINICKNKLYTNNI